MKCQKCGAEIPEGKIYCEKCGQAIQMVPDYNPVDDISIGTEESVDEQLRSRYTVMTSEQEDEDDLQHEQKPWYRRWGFRIAVLCLLGAGAIAYQAAYHFMRADQEVEAEPEETILLEKPLFSMEPGTYSHTLQLILSHTEREDGVIYYTTDGTTPDVYSSVYHSPISIDEGTTIIRAVFIRSDGMQSEEADGTYKVVFEYPDEPVFSVAEGQYVGGFLVSIRAGSGSKIYYTTNGEEPDRYSTRYTGPIQINPGLTVLQAVAVDENNRESGVVEAIYDVKEADPMVDPSADPAVQGVVPAVPAENPAP